MRAALAVAAIAAMICWTTAAGVLAFLGDPWAPVAFVISCPGWVGAGLLLDRATESDER